MNEDKMDEIIAIQNEIIAIKNLLKVRNDKIRNLEDINFNLKVGILKKEIEFYK